MNLGRRASDKGERPPAGNVLADYIVRRIVQDGLTVEQVASELKMPVDAVQKQYDSRRQ